MDATAKSWGSDVQNVETDGSPSVVQPAQAQRSALRKAAAPIIGLGVTLGAAAFIGMVNPSTSNGYPTCPTKVLFGVDCPGCGGLRCVHELMNGNLVGAFDQNLLAVIVLPLVLIAFASAVARAMMDTPNEKPALFANTVASLRTLGISINQRALVVGMVAATIVFTIVRNLPFVPFLGSGIG